MKSLIQSVVFEVVSHPYLSFMVAFIGTVGFGLVKLSSVLPH